MLLHHGSTRSARCVVSVVSHVVLARLFAIAIPRPRQTEEDFERGEGIGLTETESLELEYIRNNDAATDWNEWVGQEVGFDRCSCNVKWWGKESLGLH